MTSDNDHSGFVVEDLYHRAYSDLNQLHQQLPEDAVVVLAREVLKRLAAQLSDPKVDAPSISALSTALIEHDTSSAVTLIEDLIKSGTSITSLYLDYLAPAAARLGEWWESDEITFADVTVGTGRVYAIMRTLNRRSRPQNPPKTKSAFFAMVPEDDHVLGLKMAADLARKDGWDITLRLDSDHDTLVEDVTASGELLVGISAGGIHALPNLARLMLAIRISAPMAKIVISGHITEIAEEQVKLLHADGMARTYEDAIERMDALWAEFHDNPN